MFFLNQYPMNNTNKRNTILRNTMLELHQAHHFRRGSQKKEDNNTYPVFCSEAIFMIFMQIHVTCSNFHHPTGLDKPNSWMPATGSFSTSQNLSALSWDVDFRSLKQTLREKCRAPTKSDLLHSDVCLKRMGKQTSNWLKLSCEMPPLLILFDHILMRVG